jgi:hypothetical protein
MSVSLDFQTALIRQVPLSHTSLTAYLIGPALQKTFSADNKKPANYLLGIPMLQVPR